MPFEQLNLKEAADYLHLPESQVEKMVRNHSLTVRYIKDRPVFSKSELRDWLRTIFSSTTIWLTFVRS